MVALINIVTPRRALTAYITALSEADLDGNGELNGKELIKATKVKFRNLIFSKDLSDKEIHDLVDNILNRKV